MPVAMSGWHAGAVEKTRYTSSPAAASAPAALPVAFHNGICRPPSSCVKEKIGWCVRTATSSAIHVRNIPHAPFPSTNASSPHRQTGGLALGTVRMRSRFWLNTWSRASAVEKTPTSSRFSSSTRTWDDLCRECMLDTSVSSSSRVVRRCPPETHTTITPQMNAYLMASLIVYILPKRLRRSCLASIASHCSCSKVTGSRRRSSFRTACARVAINRNARGGVRVCEDRRNFIASDTTWHACNGAHACSRTRTTRIGGPATKGRGRAPLGTLSIAGLVIQRCFSIAAASISRV